MHSLVKALMVGSVAALAACSTAPNTQMANVLSTEMTATAAAIGYANDANHDPKVLAQIHVYRQQAWRDVQQIQAELDKNPNLNVYQSAGYQALVQVLAKLQAYEAAHGVKQ